MLGNDHRLALPLQRGDRFSQPTHRADVQGGGRLVEHVDIGMHRIGGCEDDRLLLSARQRRRARPEQVFDAKRRCRLPDAADHLLALDAVAFAAEGNLRRHVEIDELAARVLEHRADASGKLPIVQSGTGRPITRTTPRNSPSYTAGIRALIRRVSVVFPHPERPVTATHWPRGTLKETPSRDARAEFL